MERAMAGIVSRFRSAANALTPINQLPPEILCEVFFHLRPAIRRGSKQSRPARAPFEDLLAVTHTCQRWRVTAIAAAELWSQLIARDPRKNFDDMTRLFISRSGELPLDADLGYRLAVVAPHAHRLRTLSCRGCLIDDFSNLSNRPVPLLETLHILPHDYFDSENPPLPTLFNRDSPSLRELAVNGYNPFPNNCFSGLSSFHLRLSSGDVGLTFWTPLLATLRDSPQLEELFLHVGAVFNYTTSAQDIPAPAILHALQKLHLRGTPSSMTRRLLNLIDLAPNGIAMQFTNITPELDWMFPPTLPLELSLHAVTSLEIIYVSGRGLIIQGTNPGMRIRIAELSNSDAVYAEIFSRLVARPSLQFSLRELWIHVERKKEYKLPSLSGFPHLEKLAVRVTTNGYPIHRLLRMLDVDANTGHVPCPLLSTLDLSGVLGMLFLLKVLGARSKAGCRLERLRLGKAHVVMGGIVMIQLQDYVNELELFDADVEPCGMELPAVCMTELGEWWEPWTKHEVGFL